MLQLTVSATLFLFRCAFTGAIYSEVYFRLILFTLLMLAALFVRLGHYLLWHILPDLYVELFEISK